MTAGSRFVGEFTDHDITFDQTSQLGVPRNPLLSPNTRTPALDLDSVFGGGPGLRPDLYVENPDGSVGPKLKIGSEGVHEDVPRIANGDGTYTAQLGDPRNDEHVIIAGLHCAHTSCASAEPSKRRRDHPNLASLATDMASRCDRNRAGSSLSNRSPTDPSSARPRRP